jgi:hypothetical protein
LTLISPSHLDLIATVGNGIQVSSGNGVGRHSKIIYVWRRGSESELGAILGRFKLQNSKTHGAAEDASSANH